LFELVPTGTHIDFIGRRRVAILTSLLVIAVGLGSIPWRGFRTGIDFSGGTEVQLRFQGDKPVDEGEIRTVLSGLGISGASVIRFGAEGGKEFLVRVPGELAVPEAGQEAGEGEDAATTTPDSRRAYFERLQTALQTAVAPVDIERVEFVGPKVGAELRRDGILSLSVACALILVYIAFRFSLRFAPGAVVALVHDVLVTSGLWVLLGMEFDLSVLAALLAIIGYSLNDTIIVYDRIRENMALRTTREIEDLLNRSVNQTLSRTLLTSGTTLLAVLALLIFGGPVIRPFALTMAIGIVVGTYSSIYIASPMVLWLEMRFGKSAGRAAGKAAGKATGKAAGKAAS
jgi:preprotein translocase subunit SecF